MPLEKLAMMSPRKVAPVWRLSSAMTIATSELTHPTTSPARMIWERRRTLLRSMATALTLAAMPMNMTSKLRPKMSAEERPTHRPAARPASGPSMRTAMIGTSVMGMAYGTTQPGSIPRTVDIQWYSSSMPSESRASSTSSHLRRDLL